MDFDTAFDRLIGNEGGYVNNPADPGGETKFGISKRAYPSIDIASLTIDGAKAIYLRDYWITVGCPIVPDGIRFDLFDMAVNSGRSAAIKTLQQAVGENEDGEIGPLTLQAVQSMPAVRLVARFNGARLAYMTDLPAWDSFGKGWARRIANNLAAV